VGLQYISIKTVVCAVVSLRNFFRVFITKLEYNITKKKKNYMKFYKILLQVFEYNNITKKNLVSYYNHSTFFWVEDESCGFLIRNFSILLAKEEKNKLN
jgi:hypothetical protein